MQESLESPGKCTYILVKIREGANKVDSREANRSSKFRVTRSNSPTKCLPVWKRAFLTSEFSCACWSGLAAVVSALVVMLAMYTTITERTREIGILKAMGASRRYIIFIIESEALLISAVGLVAGFALSFLAGYLIHQFYGLLF